MNGTEKKRESMWRCTKKKWGKTHFITAVNGMVRMYEDVCVFVT